MSELAPDVLLARQPIFDRNMKLFAYELLYRSNSNLQNAEFIDGDLATCALLLNNYASLSQATEHHKVPAFINVTDNLFLTQDLLPIEPEKVVLELLETIKPSPELIEKIKSYREAGFKIALDDYPFTTEFEILLDHVDFIKVDVLNFDIAEIESKIEQLQNSNALLLAEKVETYEDYVTCLKLGFHLFQGYFFERPQLVHGKQLASNKAATLELLTLILDENAETDAIAQKVSQDPQLSYRLLRIINSASFGLSRKVESIKHAVVMLGLSALKRWITMLSLSSSSDASPELLKTLLIRGRCCELFGIATNTKNPDAYFTAGLFSGIDSLLGVDLDYLISELPLTDEVKSAILRFTGPCGNTLKSIIHFEHGEWGELADNPHSKLINQCYFEALQWCQEMQETFD